MTSRSGDPPLLAGLTWRQLVTERRPRRLKRGKHFRGDLRALQDAAAEAAREHGVVVRTVRDEFLKNAYLWIQFADAEIAFGEPCPCGHRTLLRTHEHFGRCPNCDKRLAFSGVVARMEGHDGRPASKLDRKLQRLRQTRLDAFSDVSLTRDETDDGDDHEIWYGRALDARGEPVLLRVVYPLESGQRLPHPELRGEELYYVSVWELDPYERARALGVMSPEPRH
jgi:hypothetical protein